MDGHNRNHTLRHVATNATARVEDSVTSPGRTSRVSAPMGMRGSKMFWLPACAHLTTDYYNGFLAPLLPIIVVRMEISLTYAALLFSVLSISTSLTQPLAGLIADRLHRYYFVLLGPIVAAAFMAFIGWVEQYWILLFILISSGIGTSIFHPQGATMVGDVVRRRRGLCMSIFNMSGAFGTAIGSMTIIPLISHFGMKSTIVTLVPALVLFAYSLRPILRSPIVHAVNHDNTDLFAAIRPHLRPLTSLYLIVVVRAVTILTFIGFIPLYLTSRGQTPAFAAVALGVYQCFIAIGMLLGGHLLDRLGARVILVLSFVFTLPFALGFVNFPSVWGLPFLIILGLFNAFSTPVNILLAQEIVPQKANFVSAIMMGFGWGIAALLVFPVGVLADRIGLYWTLIIAGSVSIVGLVLSFSFPYRQKECVPWYRARP